MAVKSIEVVFIKKRKIMFLALKIVWSWTQNYLNPGLVVSYYNMIIIIEYLKNKINKNKYSLLNIIEIF